MDLKRLLNFEEGKWKFFLEEYTPLRQRIYVGLTILFVASLSIFAFNARQTDPLNMKNTELNTEQPIGRDSMQVKMTKAVYSPKNHTAQFVFKGDGTGNDSALTGNEFKFLGKVVSGKGNLTVIPTINNQWVVLVSNLDTNFGGIQIVAESNIPEKPNINSSNIENQKPVFSTSQKDLKKVINLNASSPKTITLNAVVEEEKSNENSISKTKNKINDTKKLIEYDKSQIYKLQENTDSLTSDEVKKRSNTIENLRNEISTSETSLTELKNKLSHLKDNTKQLKDKKIAIEKGDFKLPKVQETSKVELKK